MGRRLAIFAAALVLGAGAGAVLMYMALVRREAPRERLSLPVEAPSIVVEKGARRLHLLSSGRVVATYPIGLGFDPNSDKAREGDGATPLGEFFVCAKNPQSRYYLSMCISYPNEEDAARGLRDGLVDRDEHDRIVEAVRAGRMPPQRTALGGEIYIHGHGSGSDWTLGCIALDDEAIRELYDAVPHGATVTIKP